MTKKSVPFVDMHARIQPLRAELLAACERVIDSGVFVMGPETAAFEDEFAAFCGAEHAVAVSNGTAALQLALLAANVGPGDEVITVANTFIATYEAIAAVGATPVFVDVEPDTYLIDAAACARAVTERTKAILPVHLYGQMCDMAALDAIARQHQLTVIEDACQAHGATFQGRPAGSRGDFACFSFYPGKNVGTIGEGGMVVARNGDDAERVRRLRNHGERKRYDHAEAGYNMRLPELQAAATRVQLRHAHEWNAARRQVASWYGEALAGLPIEVPGAGVGREHVFHLYVVQVETRDAVREVLAERGVMTGIHYPVPVHQQDACRSRERAIPSLPVTERLASRILSLPMFPEMTREQVDYVADVLGDVLVKDGPASIAGNGVRGHGVQSTERALAR
jgi:dTDP-4-amino-4,6-dideoxygalactose transaminase